MSSHEDVGLGVLKSKVVPSHEDVGLGVPGQKSVSERSTGRRTGPRCSSVESFGGSEARGPSGLGRSLTTIYQYVITNSNIFRKIKIDDICYMMHLSSNHISKLV